MFFFSLQEMRNIRLYIFIGLTKKAPMADITHFLSSSEILGDKNRKIKDFSSGSSRNDNVLLHCLKLTTLIGSSQVITQQDLTLLNSVFTVGTLRFLIGRSALPESQVQSASGSYLPHCISWVDHCICGQYAGPRLIEIRMEGKKWLPDRFGVICWKTVRKYTRAWHKNIDIGNFIAVIKWNSSWP